MTAIQERKRTCFVVMPFGEKKDFDGNAIDFDDIYRFFFKKAVEDLGIECVRCDEIEEAGSIHEKMFEHIYHADVVVCDITTSNANVYYELGIRHALAKGVTVLIRRRGTNIPFNIQGLQVVEYDQAKFGSIEQAKFRIHQIIKNGLDRRRNDSPVHAVLDLNIEPEGMPIGSTAFYEAALKGRDKCAIGLVTGDIQNVTGVDVWVNSENTNMQMARPFENSISGIIRFLGAEKDSENGQIKTDTIVKALDVKMGGRTSVDPATVLFTSAGEMAKSHKVKLICHAAANYGQVGQGYIPIDNVARCVTKALSATLSASEQAEVRSILFPLMATRSYGGAVLADRVRPLLNAAIEHLDKNPSGTFRKVYFLTYTDKEFEVCRDILREDGRLLPIQQVEPHAEEAVSETLVSQRPTQGSTTDASTALPVSDIARFGHKPKPISSKGTS
jgi:O-acetyl-ADP-ribose deacetylase (regulator of RNase III)